jgi:hypothetical protein
LTLYTKAAVERLASEGLFTKNYKGQKIERAKKPAKVEAPKAEKKAPVKKAPAKKAKKSE